MSARSRTGSPRLTPARLRAPAPLGGIARSYFFGEQGRSASLSASETADSLDAQAQNALSASLSASETADSLSATASAAFAPREAGLEAQEAPDSLGASASAAVQASLAASEAPDSVQANTPGAEPQVEPARHGFVLTDSAPQLWWKRRPKGMPESVAQRRVREIAGTIVRVASTQQAPTRQARRVVAEAIAPQLAQMPGFDWQGLWRSVLIAQAAQQAAQAQQTEYQRQVEQARRQAEDDLIVLLLAA